ncbi:MAG: hypothetical protein R3F20_02835 [Planctomycetota bacterium]
MSALGGLATVRGQRLRALARGEALGRRIAIPVGLTRSWLAGVTVEGRATSARLQAGLLRVEVPPLVRGAREALLEIDVEGEPLRLPTARDRELDDAGASVPNYRVLGAEERRARRLAALRHLREARHRILAAAAADGDDLARRARVFAQDLETTTHPQIDGFVDPDGDRLQPAGRARGALPAADRRARLALAPLLAERRRGRLALDEPSPAALPALDAVAAHHESLLRRAFADEAGRLDWEILVVAHERLAAGELRLARPGFRDEWDADVPRLILSSELLLLRARREESREALRLAAVLVETTGLALDCHAPRHRMALSDWVRAPLLPDASARLASWRRRREGYDRLTGLDRHAVLERLDGLQSLNCRRALRDLRAD